MINLFYNLQNIFNGIILYLNSVSTRLKKFLNRYFQFETILFFNNEAANRPSKMLSEPVM